MTTKHECPGRVADRELRGMIYSCRRNATVEHDGKWYCWQHDPERMEANRKKRMATWDTKQDRRLAMYTRRARNAKLAQLVTPELAALLEKVGDLTVGDKGWTSIGLFTSQDGEWCHILAARIRETLALEVEHE